MEHEAFVDRVIKHLPSSPSRFTFVNWSHQGRPSKEGIAIMPIEGVDPEKVLDAVMDVDGYVGNLDYVDACRSVTDDRFVPPEKVRFYQKVKVPLVGSVHHELVLHRLGEKSGYHISAWDILRSETDRLSPKEAFRSDYNHGAWFVAPGVLGYSLGSAPQRKDVGFVKWKVLTKGADATASRVLKANIEGMARWAARR